MTLQRATLAHTFLLLSLIAAPAQAQYIEEWSGAETVMDETMLTAADQRTSPETANQYYAPQFNGNAYYPYQQAAQPQPQPQQQYAQQPYPQQQQYPQYAAQQYQQYYYQLNNPMASPLPATPQQPLVTPASMAGNLPAWQPATNADPAGQKSKSGRWQSLVNAVSNSSSNVLPLLNSVLQRL